MIGAAGAGVYVLHYYSKDLPDHSVLRNYAPPVMTRFHASDGALLAEYAEQWRMYQPIQTVPQVMVDAITSAEDKSFFSHSGINYLSLARAVVHNVRNWGSGKRPLGASTITMQVAKNFFTEEERRKAVSIDRKIREALIAGRLERTFSKDQILELYLNEIFFGMRTYGIAAASLAYFDKAVHELTLPEAAYLAALPKAPNNYHPIHNKAAAIERRNWVIDRMFEDKRISAEEALEAKAAPLTVKLRRKRGAHGASAEYFAEEVRRQLLELYGDKGLYRSGLSVRTTLDRDMQTLARGVLMKHLRAFDRTQGWRGAPAHIDLNGDWIGQIEELIQAGKIHELIDVPGFAIAVVTAVGDSTATITLFPKKTSNGRRSSAFDNITMTFADMAWDKWDARMKRRNSKRYRASIDEPADLIRRGDVIYVGVQPNADAGRRYSLEQIPEISGALVAMDPHTGRVLALVGGFSYHSSQFNRATQATRQPGSAFKPFVYAAALDNGYTPTSIMLDAEIWVKSGGEWWSPRNYSKSYYGPSTLRLGVERSRNAMTVRLAKNLGMPLIAEYAKLLGIYDELRPYLPMSLGAGETTVLRLTTAYSILANGGKKIRATMIDRVQDRYGRTIYKHDQRGCALCLADGWHNQDEPQLIDNREQVFDPMTAAQITSMMEGVVQRGTGRIVGEIGKPIAGKTGTTNDNKDAWFVGYSPDLAVGVFIGYDQPHSMGEGATGGRLAAPVFKEFMQAALAEKPAVQFPIPDGMLSYWVDAKTGRHAVPDQAGAIREIFKPGTGPREGAFQYQDNQNAPVQLDSGNRGGANDFLPLPADTGNTPAGGGVSLGEEDVARSGGLY